MESSVDGEFTTLTFDEMGSSADWELIKWEFNETGS